MEKKNKTIGIGQIVIVVFLAVNFVATAALGFYTVSREDGTGENADGIYTATEKYMLYIGLNDKDTYEQIIDTEEAVRMVNEICTRYVEGYTMQIAKGGWMDEKNILTEENTLIYSFYEVTDEQVMQIMDDVLQELNQNSILVSHGEENSTYYYGNGE